MQSQQLQALIDRARHAAEQHEYDQALECVRRAQGLAPMRRDLHQLLSQIVAQRAAFDARNNPAAEGGDDYTSEPEEEIPAIEPARATSSYAEERHPMLRVSTARRGRTPRQELSEHRRTQRRHRFSKILTGMLLALVLLLFGIGLGWVIINHEQLFKGDLIHRESAEQRELREAIERAEVYRKRNDFALALEQITALTPTLERDHYLASLHMDQGDSFLHRTPPNYASAREAYINAVILDPNNPSYGHALGLVNYQLGRSYLNKDRDRAAQFFDDAITAYQAVLKRHPEQVEVLVDLGQVASQANRRELAIEAWRSIIRLAPEAEAAELARNHLKAWRMSPEG